VTFKQKKDDASMYIYYISAERWCIVCPNECQSKANQPTVALHVCMISITITYVFKESNESKDLQFGRVRDSIPGFGCGGNLGERSSIQHHWPRPSDLVSVYNVSNESEHSNTSMLDLGFSQESNGRFLTGSPEAGGRKTKRVEARYKRI
jgi:hypothetical protein